MQGRNLEDCPSLGLAPPYRRLAVTTEGVRPVQPHDRHVPRSQPPNQPCSCAHGKEFHPSHQHNPIHHEGLLRRENQQHEVIAQGAAAQPRSLKEPGLDSRSYLLRGGNDGP